MDDLMGMCGDDPKTTGHVDLILCADLIATNLLNGDTERAKYHAERYQATRFLAAAQSQERQREK